jgi:DMSO reductase anchor subunit
MTAELIPPARQVLWGLPAVANFALGGLGAGYYVAAAVAAGFQDSPALARAAWLGPLLVLAGFAAVAGEAGRPLRGARVLARVRTSWMSRELLLGGVFVLLGAAECVGPSPALRGLTALAALALAGAQGMIVRRARAVAAWDVPVVPVVFVVSALVSGVGLLLAAEGARGHAPGGAGLGAALATLVGAALVWRGYLRWSPDPAFERATRPLRDGRIALGIAGIGYALPFVLLSLAVALGGRAPAAAFLAGVLMIAGQVETKRALILTAGELRPIALPGLRLPAPAGARRRA